MRALLAALPLAAALAGPAQADPLKLLTGPPGSDAYAFAGAVQQIVGRRLPAQVLQVLAGTAAGNLDDIERGGADFAFTFSILAVDAVEGRRPFKNPAKDICHVLSFTPQLFHIAVLADGDARRMQDLKGRSAAFRPRGVAIEQVTSAVLAAHGLGYPDFSRVVFGSRNDGVQLMKDAEVEIFTLSAAPPAPALRDIAAVRDIRLISLEAAAIDQMRGDNPGYRRFVIEAGAYPKQTDAVATVGYLTHLVARCSLGEDEVHAVARAIIAEFATIQAVSREAGRLKAADLGAEVGIAFHSGALRALREAGLR